MMNICTLMTKLFKQWQLQETDTGTITPPVEDPRTTQTEVTVDKEEKCTDLGQKQLLNHSWLQVLPTTLVKKDCKCPLIQFVYYFVLCLKFMLGLMGF